MHKTAEQQPEKVVLEENANKVSSGKNDKAVRPPFTAIDWIIAACSIALLAYIFLNLPAY